MNEVTLTPEALEIASKMAARAAIQQSALFNGMVFSIAFYMDRLHKEFGVPKEELNAGLVEAMLKWKEEGGEKSNWVETYTRYIAGDYEPL